MFLFSMATLKQLQPPALSAADYATYQKYYGQQALQQYYKDYYRQQAAAAGHQQLPTGKLTRHQQLPTGKFTRHPQLPTDKLTRLLKLPAGSFPVVNRWVD